MLNIQELHVLKKQLIMIIIQQDIQQNTTSLLGAPCHRTR